MKLSIEKLLRQWDLLRRWARSSGQDVVATTRDSVSSVEAQTGAAAFAFLAVLSLWGSGSAHVPAAEAELLAWGERGIALGSATGAALGVIASAIVGMGWGVLWANAWDLIGVAGRPWRRENQPVRWRVAIAAAGVLFLHLSVVYRDVARHPAFYFDFLSPDEGLARRLLGVLADQRPFWLRWALNGGFALIVLAAAVQIVRRLSGWFLAFNRPTRLAIVVLGTFTLVAGAGFRVVRSSQLPRNIGPNAIVIVLDGLRSDRLFAADKDVPAPALSRWVSRGRSFWRCVPPGPEKNMAVMTLLTGQSPAGHGVRHRFPGSWEARLTPESLPLLLHANEYRTAVLSDAGGDLYRRVEDDFDEVRAPSRRARAVVLRRAIERVGPLRPYVSGRWGRTIFPALRGSPGLADPDLLSAEARRWLAGQRFQSKFALFLDFSALTEPAAPVNRTAWRAWRARSRGAAGGATGFEAAALYDANLVALDEALERLAAGLRAEGLEENTLVVLWSPRGRALSAAEVAGEAALDGPVFDAAPFALMEPHMRSGARHTVGLIAAQDVAPTLLDELRLAVPESMEGVPVFDGEAEEGTLASIESEGLTDGLFALPPVSSLLIEDRDAPGRPMLDPAYLDRVLTGKRRVLRWPGERLVYEPTLEGVRFRYYRDDAPSAGDLGVSRAWAPRVKELKEDFYRHLSREPGWRPQNDYWLPEALLREEPFRPEEDGRD